MTRFAIAMTTCDRVQFGKRNYFDATVASLRASGFEQQVLPGDAKRIFSAGPDHDWARRAATMLLWPVYGGPPHCLDVVRNFHRAFAWMCSQPCTHGMLLVDDMAVCRNFLARMREWVGQVDADLYSPCSQYKFTTEPVNVARGWAEYPYRNFYGGIGLVWRLDSMPGYLFSDHRQDAEMSNCGAEMAWKRYWEASGLRLVAHSPNIACHMGKESTLNHVHSMTDRYFPGEDYDALGLHEGHEG